MVVGWKNLVKICHDTQFNKNNMNKNTKFAHYDMDGKGPYVKLARPDWSAPISISISTNCSLLYRIPYSSLNLVHSSRVCIPLFPSFLRSMHCACACLRCACVRVCRACLVLGKFSRFLRWTSCFADFLQKRLDVCSCSTYSAAPLVSPR